MVQLVKYGALSGGEKYNVNVLNIDGLSTDTKPTILNDWCKTIGKMIGVETLHPHDWRHSGASALKNAGMALEDVSALLNHASTDVTKKFYIKENRKRISKLKDEFTI